MKASNLLKEKLDSLLHHALKIQEQAVKDQFPFDICNYIAINLLEGEDQFNFSPTEDEIGYVEKRVKRFYKFNNLVANH